MAVHKIRPWHLVLLGAILIVAAVVRWHKIDSASFWIDELLSLEVSSGHGYEHRDFPQGVVFTPTRGLTGIDADGSWKNVFLSLGRTNHPPLYFCALRVWESMLHSDGDFAIRSLSALCSLIAILLAFDAARLLHGTRIALFAAAVMALAAPQIQYAQEARAYAMLVALMLGCCDAVIRIEKLGTTRRRSVALFFCAFAMLMTHYLAFAVFAALLAYALIRLRGTGAAGTLAAAAICMFAIWGPVMLAQATQPTSNLSWMNEAARGSGRTALTRLAMLPLRFFINPGPTPPATAYFGIILFALPALMLKRRPDLLLWSLILWVGTFTIVAGDLLHSTSALSIPRYTLPAAAAANLLLVAIADSLIPRRPYIAPALLAVACAFALPGSYERDKPDFRTLASFLDNHCRKDAVLVLYAAPEFDWYPGLLELGLSHYCHVQDRPTLLLTNRASSGLVQQLEKDHAVDVVWSGTVLNSILPGCRELEGQNFPFVGQCARVAWPQPMAPVAQQPNGPVVDATPKPQRS